MKRCLIIASTILGICALIWLVSYVHCESLTSRFTQSELQSLFEDNYCPFVDPPLCKVLSYAEPTVNYKKIKIYAKDRYCGFVFVFEWQKQDEKWEEVYDKGIWAVSGSANFDDGFVWPYFR